LVGSPTRLSGFTFIGMGIAISRQVTYVFVGLQNDMATIAAISPIGTSVGNIFFPSETDAAMATITGNQGYLYLIYKHGGLMESSLRVQSSSVRATLSLAKH
jgi:hypothetical protein